MPMPIPTYGGNTARGGIYRSVAAKNAFDPAEIFSLPRVQVFFPCFSCVFLLYLS